MASEIDFQLEDALALLQRAPGVLRAQLAGLPEAWVHNNYGADTFSPFAVVGHLLHAEVDNWIPRLRIILNEGTGRPFAPFDRYAMLATSRGKSLAHLLDGFEQARGASLSALRDLRLTPEQLGAKGTHPDLGEVTARQLLATWVVHDQNHIHQIAKCLAWQYRVAIGPWRPYIGVLPRE